MQKSRLKRATNDIASRALEYLQDKGESTTNNDLSARFFVDLINTCYREVLNPEYPRHDKVDREYTVKGTSGLLIELRDFREKVDKDPVDGDKPYEVVINGIDTTISILEQGKGIEEYVEEDVYLLLNSVKDALYPKEEQDDKGKESKPDIL